MGGAGTAADPRFPAGSLAQDPRYTLTVQETVTVQEGLCVFVPCTVTYPKTASTFAYGYWFREGDNANSAAVATSNTSREVKEETKGRFQLLGDPRKYNCSLDIRDARRTDDGLYFFRIESIYNLKYTYIQNKLSVHVTGERQAPAEPTVEVHGGPRAGLGWELLDQSLRLLSGLHLGPPT